MGYGDCEDINVLALIKGKERYIFLYDDESRAELLRVLGRFASNPELSFSWYDAAMLSQRIRQESKERGIKRDFSNYFKNPGEDYYFDDEGLDGFLSSDDFLD